MLPGVLDQLAVGAQFATGIRAAVRVTERTQVIVT